MLRGISSRVEFRVSLGCSLIETLLERVCPSPLNTPQNLLLSHFSREARLHQAKIRTLAPHPQASHSS
jgi:hypothetical protein